MTNLIDEFLKKHPFSQVTLRCYGDDLLLNTYAVEYLYNSPVHMSCDGSLSGEEVFVELSVGKYPYGLPAIDLRTELYKHTKARNPVAWKNRCLDEIHGITIHHTLSDSPWATAKAYCLSNSRPSIPYTVWVAQTGEVYLCNSLELACWHDHTGDRNLHLSIGLAGRLHEYPPTDVQMDSTVRVLVWALTSPLLPHVYSHNQVKGHCDFYRTECPGWVSYKSGMWRSRLMNTLALELKK